DITARSELIASERAEDDDRRIGRELRTVCGVEDVGKLPPHLCRLLGGSSDVRPRLCERCTDRIKRAALIDVSSVTVHRGILYNRSTDVGPRGCRSPSHDARLRYQVAS